MLLDATEGGEASPTLENVVLRANTAANSGGGLEMGSSDGGISKPLITGCTFENNAAQNGGAINIFTFGDKANPTIRNSMFRNNKADHEGGAIDNFASQGGSEASPTIENVTFKNNHGVLDPPADSELGGGAIWNVAFEGATTKPTISNSEFIGNQAAPQNTAPTDTADGGAIFSSSDSTTTGGTKSTVAFDIDNTTFKNNFASRTGGAIFSIAFQGGDVQSAITGSEFIDNTASFSGALFIDGFRGSGGSNPPPPTTNGISVTNTTLSGNQAVETEVESGDNALGRSGSPPVNTAGTIGVLAERGGQVDATIRNVDITGGTGQDADVGGAIDIASDTTSNSSLSSLATSTYENITIRNVSAERGGAIGVLGDEEEARPRFENITISGAEAKRGGAIAVMGKAGNGNAGVAEPVFVNTTIAGNSADLGGAVYDSTSGSGTVAAPSFTNTILWNNTAVESGPAVYNTNNGTASIDYSIVENGSAAIEGGSAFSNGTANLNQNPLFNEGASLAGSDGMLATVDDSLNIAPSSPAIDAGTNDAVSALTDITGASRVQDRDGNGTATVNMGAYETPSDATSDIIYVDASGSGGDGSSWANAYADLQTAIDAAAPSDEIWVAQGTYTPASATDSITFSGAKDGLKIYGGFANGDSFSDRDPAAKPTILSGDVGGDDDPFAPNTDSDGDSSTPTQTDHINGDNSNHVLYLDGGGAGNITPNTVIDGFKIIAGQANVKSGETKTKGGAGGGLFCDGEGTGNECSPTLANVVFKGNLAFDEFDSAGGALFSDGSEGGTSSPIIKNARFVGNTARYGGAIGNFGFDGGTSSPEIIGSVFVNNATSTYGVSSTEGAPSSGAILNEGSLNGENRTVIRQTVFANNSSTFGGAIQNYSDNGISSPRIRDVVFVNNTAKGQSSSDGGALVNFADGGTTKPVVTNVTFVGNAAVESGGAIANYGSGTNEPTINNTIFWKNVADVDGDDNGNGDAIYSFGATAALSHTILDDGPAGVLEKNGAVTDYLDDGGSATTFENSSNFDRHPGFEYLPLPEGDDGTFGTDDDGLHLTAESAALNAGDDGAVTTSTDVTGATRTQDGVVDIGAYEGSRDQERIIYVDPDNNSGPYDGTSWASADTTLQDTSSVQGPLSYATGNDEIWIAEGSYTSGLTPDSAFYVTGAQDGIGIYGGFDGTESVRSGRDPSANPTVLSGDVGGNDDSFDPNTDSDGDPSTPTQTDHINGDNSKHAIAFLGGNANPRSGDITSATVLDGVILRSGKAGQSGEPDVGGGMYCGGQGSGNRCNLTIRDVTFEGNYAPLGGGLFLDANAEAGGGDAGTASPTLENVTFRHNAGDKGGAVFSDGGTSSPTITGSLFKNNVARTGGAFYNGALAAGAANPSIENTIFANNTADERGGALRNVAANDGQANPVLQNVEFKQNRAAANPPVGSELGGGAIWNNSFSGGTASPQISNSTFDGNEARPSAQDIAALGGAMYSIASGSDGSGNVSTASPTIDNVTFKNNVAQGAGGAYFSISVNGGVVQSSITGSTFSNNKADAGGGLFIDGFRGSPTNSETVNKLSVSNTTFSGNQAVDTGLNVGDEISNTSGRPEIGGSIYVLAERGGQVDATITNVDITGGSGTDAHTGGGILVTADTTQDASISSRATPTFTNVTIQDVSAERGGAISVFADEQEARPRFENVVITGAEAAQAGGAIEVVGKNLDQNDNPAAAEPTFVNTTIAGNSADRGGAVYDTTSGSGTVAAPTFTNTILWDNSARESGAEVYNAGNGSATIDYSIVEGGDAAIANGSAFGNGTGNLDTDPRFEYPPLPKGDDATLGTPDDGLRLLPSSPAIDAGDNDVVTTSKDVAGATRTQNTTVDIGAYEGGQDLSRTIYVDADNTSGTYDGTSWASADTTLQDTTTGVQGPLGYATGNDEIWVAEGTYTPSRAPDSSYTITGAQDGLKIYGGFSGGEDSRSARDADANPTVLSGDVDENDVLFAPNTNSDENSSTYTQTDHHRGDNSPNVVALLGGNLNPRSGDITSATVIDGVVIRSGDADSGAAVAGGMYCGGQGSGNRCNPTIRNVVFEGNYAGLGGGLFLDANAEAGGDDAGTASPTLENVTFRHNAADDGGAVFSDGGTSSPTITGSLFENNVARNGGAFYNESIAAGAANPSIENTTFKNNTADERGGALRNVAANDGQANPVLQNVEFKQNRAAANPPVGSELGGGAIWNNSYNGGTASPQISNSTFDGNEARPSAQDIAALGGAMYSIASGSDGSGNVSTASPTIDNVTFKNNVAQGAGGAYFSISVNGGVVQSSITGSTFSNNEADAGGGLFIDGFRGAPTNSETVNKLSVSNTTFSGNQAVDTGLNVGDEISNTSGRSEIGGSIYVLAERGGQVDATITNVDITGGSGTDAHTGGGILVTADTTQDPNISSRATPTFTNVTIQDVSAERGGAISVFADEQEARPRFENVVITGAEATTAGGAIEVVGKNLDQNDNPAAAEPTFVNTTIAGNSADRGGAVYDSTSGSGTIATPSFTNAILWGNAAESGPAVYNANSGTATIDYSIVENGDAAIANGSAFGSGTNNLNKDPLFNGGSSFAGPDGTIATADDSLAVASTSPAVEAGLNDAVSASTDITGADRLQDGNSSGTAVVDMGAYEIPTGAGEPLSAPTALSASTVDGSDVNLSWDAADGQTPSQYRIYRDTSPLDGSPSDYSALATVGGSVTSYTDQPAVGQAYYYRVTTVGENGEESDFSGEAGAFLPPETVSADISRSFGDEGTSGDYRLVALPGEPGRPIGKSIRGEAGSKWQAYRDDGSNEDFLVRYDGASSDFTFRSGNGFWLTSIQSWTESSEFSTVELRDGAAKIDLRDGWNVISNPLGTDVRWSDVETSNVDTESGERLQPLWSFDGSFTNVVQSEGGTFASAKDGEAYYFLNDRGLDSLRIPHPNAPSSKAAAKSGSGATAETDSLLALTARVGNTAASTVRIGLRKSKGAKTFAVPAPPGRFEATSLRIEAQNDAAKEAAARSSLLMSERRVLDGKGETFHLRLRSRAEKTGVLSAQNLDVLGDWSVALLNPSAGTTYDLRKTSAPEVSLKGGSGTLKLAIGTEAYVERKKKTVLPEEVNLTSYPNPVHQQATVEYALPEKQSVELRLYDALGRVVATLASGEKEAGRHTVQLDAGRLASGTYFGRLRAESRTVTVKITIIR